MIQPRERSRRAAMASTLVASSSGTWAVTTFVSMKIAFNRSESYCIRMIERGWGFCFFVAELLYFKAAYASC
jgi:hypothetical protein